MPRSDSPAPSRARLLLAALVLAAFAALLALRIHHWGGLDQTALFYVGLPATIALLVVFTVRARSAMGVTMAVTTLCLALAGPLLGEGMVCLLIAAPLIYGVVAVVTWTAGALVAWRDRSRHALFAAPLLFVLALEGVAGTSLLPREDRGEGHVLVPAAPHEVAAALAAPPAYAAPDALFLRAVPFPEPVSASGGGLDVGDTRHVRFTPRRTLEPGAEPTPRHMELRVTASEVRGDGGRVVFEVAEDTAFANWMDMRGAEAVWRAEGDGTRLAWSIDYERTYEPSWYFGPIQSYATDLAAEYLAATFGAAAPEGSR
ncbi:hypothetical protein KGD83_25790 [Nocardiopsis akebiae]|uniref:SRPBCC family protein n=1 Tax=Nocardiopsis akebiae TaxID=2831968 RepID=A0ABX8C2G7_9ACTN|nr:hypothetical protein [Nocardiopsis akebiae]QUX28591.1 hypothetical protein KGD83_25790 [Nocardiopsis akebiae]